MLIGNRNLAKITGGNGYPICQMDDTIDTEVIGQGDFDTRPEPDLTQANFEPRNDNMIDPTSVSVADGKMFADGESVYEAKDLKVGLFAPSAESA